MNHGKVSVARTPAELLAFGFTEAEASTVRLPALVSVVLVQAPGEEASESLREYWARLNEPASFGGEGTLPTPESHGGSLEQL